MGSVDSVNNKETKEGKTSEYYSHYHHHQPIVIVMFMIITIAAFSDSACHFPMSDFPSEFFPSADPVRLTLFSLFTQNKRGVQQTVHHIPPF